MITKPGFNYAFKQEACESCQGKCCRGDSGKIYLNRFDIKNIAKFLGINQFDFIREYLVKYRYRYSIKEEFNGKEHYCVFFDQDSFKCRIYDIRPKQCRTFPFWEYYKENFKELKKECKGILIKKRGTNNE